MKNPRLNPELKPQFFSDLPSEVAIDILSRLPIRTIGICKSVCKSWRDLLHTRKFADSHLAKSMPGLVISKYLEHDWDSKNFEIFEFVDELGLERHDLHYKPLTKFDSVEFVGRSDLQGSANGLLFWCRTDSKPVALFVCNPLTREYIRLPSLDNSIHRYPAVVTYGFGVSKWTAQYKVVRILQEYKYDHSSRTSKITKSLCHVYSLGTGVWKSIAPAPPFLYDCGSIGVSLNGNLHWLVEVTDGSLRILCFDLETDVFSSFSPPPTVSDKLRVGLVALGDCLCICDNSDEDAIVIWLMKEYGDEKSWTHEFVIGKSLQFVGDSDAFTESLYPIKVFKDGDILMAWFDSYMFYCSNKNKTITRIDSFGLDEDRDDEDSSMKAMLHTSSFLSLRSFPKESVSSF